MNKRQKEVIQHQLTMEKAVLDALEKEYRAALKDINLKIQMLQSDPLTQSRIYHIQYQKTLKKQVEASLEKLHSDEYSTIQEYLSNSYTDAFVGTMYDVHGQDVPVIAPIDQNAAIKAVLTDSKLSKPLYDALGVDVNKLKKNISQEISRGIASGLLYDEIARNIEFYTNAPISRAKTIVRTEGHRIQEASAEDARQQAKAKGADVVKQWDATLDGETRPTHRELDGQIREVDKPFEANGKKAMYPGEFGDPAEDCNCRCVALTRARWALDEDELETLKERAKFFDMDKSAGFDDFKKKYVKASEAVDKAEKADHPAHNKFGQAIIFDERMEASEQWSDAVRVIKELSDEYDTRLIAVKIGAKYAGAVDQGGTMYLSSKKPDVAFHEFAHSIAMENLTKYGVTDDSDFWKEIKAIKRAYRRDVKDDTKRFISNYEHGTNKVDEFLAEAFTQAKMAEIGLPIPEKYGNDLTYSKKVLATVDKYFKKPSAKTAGTLENTGKSGIIEVELDELVPCLKDAKTGKLYDTTVRNISDRNELGKYNKNNGWFINWNKVPADCTVSELRLKGDEVTQGLVAYKVDDGNSAAFAHWVVSAPHNRGEDKQFTGVGGHLFAIMADASEKAGYGGFIYGQATSKEVLEYYKDKYGAKQLDGLRFYIDEKAAHEKILDIYNFEREDE